MNTFAAGAAADFTFGQALATPAFWVVVVGSSLFNLVWSGVTLFNESMLAERGLDGGVAIEIMAILTGIGLLANLVGGALASRTRVVKLLGIGLALLAAVLVMFPTIDGVTARCTALRHGDRSHWWTRHGGFLRGFWTSLWPHAARPHSRGGRNSRPCSPRPWDRC